MDTTSEKNGLTLEPNGVTRRHRFRFSMKSLLLTMTLISVVLAMIAQPLVEARRNQQCLDQAIALGAKVAVRGTIMRGFSVARYVLAMFSVSYDRNRLYGLDFSGTKISDDNLKEIVKLRHIEELNLENTQITDDGLLYLRELEYLRNLNLGGTRVTDQGMQHLSKIGTLLSLHVVRTQVTYAALEELDSTFGVTHFCEEKAIKELEALGVQVVHIPRHVVVEVKEGYTRYLNTGEEAVDVFLGGMVRNRSLTGEEAAQLGYLTSLENLDINSGSIEPGGFAAMKRLPKLKTLEISSTDLTDSDLEGISRQTQIETIRLSWCSEITDEGLMHLKTLKNLKKLEVEWCKGISIEGFSALIHELPDCQPRFQEFR